MVLVDEEGTVQEMKFSCKRNFEVWAATNTLSLPDENGCMQCINAWEDLEDGGKYKVARTLEKTVSGINACSGAPTVMWLLVSRSA